MRNSAFPLRGAAAALILCGYATQPYAEESDFAQALADQYAALAEVEREQGDQRDAAAYTSRATGARAGNPVPPQAVEARVAFLPAHYVTELVDARHRLVSALDGGGRNRASIAAARAQTSYDCWLEQASEDLQPAHIAACKDAYLSAIDEVESALVVVAEVAPPPPPPPPAAPALAVATSYVVYFGYDSAAIDAEGRRVLAQVKSALDDTPAQRIVLIGHASTPGSDAYNQKLSARRAAAVKSSLIDIGVPSDALRASAVGEDDLPVPTGDNVNEPKNRQVEISVRR